METYTAWGLSLTGGIDDGCGTIAGVEKAFGSNAGGSAAAGFITGGIDDSPGTIAGVEKAFASKAGSAAAGFISCVEDPL
jgi:hypothetical protein